MTPDVHVDVKALAAIASGEKRRNGTAPSTSVLEPGRGDLANVARFVAEHEGRLRYVVQHRRWLRWDGQWWREDRTGGAERAAKNTARRLLAEAVALPDEKARLAAVKWALTSQNEPRIRAMLSLAATEPEFAVSTDELDAHPFLFAAANGTVDLATGDLRPADPECLLTRGTDVAYEPRARCPRWESFLREVFAGDDELVAFVQRLAGYALTGDTREHTLAVLHGRGANGKSTFVNTLRHVVGEHGAVAAFDTFVRSRDDRGPRNDLARLAGARLVCASESGEGRRLDEATVKQLTGGDTVAARFLYGEHFEFAPQFKLLLVTNHRPRVDGDDDAIWRRLRLIPFSVSFQGREDRDLEATLERELPGILAWAVSGCLEWQREGLGQAGAVQRATRDYRQEEDLLGQFLEEVCTPGGEVSAREFRAAYERHCEANGERPLSNVALGKRLAQRGVDQRRAKGARFYVGLQLVGVPDTGRCQ